MSSSAQIKSTVRNIEVGNRNATNRSDRSPPVNFNRVPHSGVFAAGQKLFPNLGRVAVGRIVRIIANSAGRPIMQPSDSTRKKGCEKFVSAHIRKTQQ
jgi:hypothetical protein